MQPIFDAFFDGKAPPARAGLSPKQHYFDVYRGWKQSAQQRTGRLLVQVGKQRPSGRGRHEVESLTSLWTEWGTPVPHTYSIFDVTDFSEHHPGIELQEAAAVADATAWFEVLWL